MDKIIKHLVDRCREQFSYYDIVDECSEMVDYGSIIEFLFTEITGGVVISKIETTTATDNNVGHKWIPVTERLPKKECRYLVINESGNVFDAYYDETEEGFGEWVQTFDTTTLGVIDTEWQSVEEITHWMPIPPLPKEGE